MSLDRVGEFFNKHKRSTAVYGAIAVALAKTLSDQYDGVFLNLDLRRVKPIEGRHGPRLAFSDGNFELQISYTKVMRKVFCGDNLPLANTAYLTETTTYSLEGKRVFQTSAAIPPSRACARLVSK